ncbi:39S ribosomal protein L55, mitochondrial isoform X2 [Cebus imitator]|uniref:39S ribosomal protein L55, mitochondrial isoform X2 n=1 Tax=Cebus imitator TaxID=2715852 RepID=UPI00080A4487|nr:39S ribosomal protein L55, mitochondrial isoform X2 [Cebus imitator]
MPLLSLAASSWLGSQSGSHHSLRLLRKPLGSSCTCMFICSLLRCSAVKATGPALRCLHTSSWRADSSRASFGRVRRQAYARLYPVLLVKQDGSTVHIRYREPRRMLVMPIDLDTLTPEERRARLRKREAQLQRTKDYEQELSDDFDVERYRQFWAKTKK